MADRFRQFIAGENREARLRETFAVESPATSRIASEVVQGGADDPDDAIAAGRRTFDDRHWAGIRCQDRAGIRNRAARLVEEHVDEFARRETRAQLSRLPESLEFVGEVAQTHEGGVPDFGAQYANYVQRVPVGVMCLLTLWNHSLLILMKKLSAVLAAGNSVVVQFEEEAEAVRLSNDSHSGLAASVWTLDEACGHRISDQRGVGVIWLNDHHRNDPSSVWGGMQDSGTGREYGIEGHPSRTQSRSTNVGPIGEPLDRFDTSENRRYS